MDTAYDHEIPAGTTTAFLRGLPCDIMNSAMKPTSITASLDALLPIIILVLFFGFPYLLKALGRRSMQGRGEPLDREMPREKDTSPTAGGRDTLAGDWPDTKDHVHDVPDNKPIHPKWF